MEKEGVRGIVVNTDEGKWLVVADTHVGIEYELMRKGIVVPRQWRRIAETLINDADKIGASTLVILGDVKHEIARAEPKEDVKAFLEELSGKFERVILVKGNHDGLLERLALDLNKPNIYVIDSRGFTIEEKGGKRLLLLHGNAKPRPEDLLRCDAIIMGHTHPAIYLQDVTGYVIKSPVFVRLKVNKAVLFERMYDRQVDVKGEVTIVILPTYNPLIIGIDVTQVLSRSFRQVESILNYIRERDVIRQAEVYLLDMTYLGTLELLVRAKEEFIIEVMHDMSWL